VLIGFAALLLGCGGERNFSAEEFVEEANGHGAGLVLGERLTSGSPDVETYALTLEERPPKQGPGNQDDQGAGHGGGGSLSVQPGVDEAEREYRNCRNAITLVCFRAANVVLILEESGEIAALKAVEDAVLALAN
jgi:hypothetical protein